MANIQNVALVDRGRVITGGGGSSTSSKWTNPVSCSIGDTTVTIEDDNILTSSAIDVYIQTASGAEVPHDSVEVSAGEAVITFSSALEEAAEVRLNILDTTSKEWSSSVSCSIGATTATIIDSNLYPTSIVKVYCEVASGTPINITSITVTTGQAVIEFKELEEAANIKLLITNL